MFKGIVRTVCTVASILLAVGAAEAQPITLKFAYITSDTTTNYLAAIEPFVSAVNAEGRGVVSIEVSPSGALGDDPMDQLDLVLTGVADFAFIIPGYTPERFTDSNVIDLPGMAADTREATLLYTDLVQRGLLAGYDDLFVVGALASGPAGIHGRSAISSVADLAGLRIRTSNQAQAAALAGLGATPVFMSLNQVSGAIGAGELDGIAIQSVPLFEFGIARVAAHHFLLGIGTNPLAIVMSKARFDSLPANVQQIIAAHSGPWLATQFIAANNQRSDEAMAELLGDPNRVVVLPSAQDQATADAAYAAELTQWLAAAPTHADLLAAAQASLAVIRAGR